MRAVSEAVRQPVNKSIFLHTDIHTHVYPLRLQIHRGVLYFQPILTRFDIQ